MSIEVIGLVAGVFTTTAAIPQIIKTIRLKEVRDISFLYYLLLVLGCILWLVYGVTIASLSLIFWNVIATLLNSTIFALKIYYSRDSQQR